MAPVVPVAPAVPVVPVAPAAPAASRSVRALAWFLALTGTPEEHADTEFLSAGFDSVGLVTLSERISQEHGLSLYPTVFFEYPTPRQFAEFLVEEAPGLVDTMAAPAAPAAPTAPADQAPQAAPEPKAAPEAAVPAAPAEPTPVARATVTPRTPDAAHAAEPPHSPRRHPGRGTSQSWAPPSGCPPRAP